MAERMKTASRAKTSARKASKPFVIVRSHTAGVHAGYYHSRKGNTVILTSSVRLWRWCGASLSQVAVTGPATGDNRFGVVVPRTEIVSPQGFEIIFCTPQATMAIQSVSSWIK